MAGVDAPVGSGSSAGGGDANGDDEQGASTACARCCKVSPLQLENEVRAMHRVENAVGDDVSTANLLRRDGAMFTTKGGPHLFGARSMFLVCSPIPGLHLGTDADGRGDYFYLPPTWQRTDMQALHSRLGHAVALEILYICGALDDAKCTESWAVRTIKARLPPYPREAAKHEPLRTEVQEQVHARYFLRALRM